MSLLLLTPNFLAPSDFLGADADFLNPVIDFMVAVVLALDTLELSLNMVTSNVLVFPIGAAVVLALVVGAVNTVVGAGATGVVVTVTGGFSIGTTGFIAGVLSANSSSFWPDKDLMTLSSSLSPFHVSSTFEVLGGDAVVPKLLLELLSNANLCKYFLYSNAALV
jgi:hypothetical protein